MTTYEILDLICDAINPLLASVLIFILSKKLWSRSWSSAVALTYKLILFLAIVYGIAFIDIFLGIWKSFDADYSGHTAFFIAITLLIIDDVGHKLKLVGLFVLYATLMFIQSYHTPFDVISTMWVVVIMLFLANTFLIEYWKRQSRNM